jgi:hypothetical protein
VIQLRFVATSRGPNEVHVTIRRRRGGDGEAWDRTGRLIASVETYHLLVELLERGGARVETTGLVDPPRAQVDHYQPRKYG